MRPIDAEALMEELCKECNHEGDDEICPCYFANLIMDQKTFSGWISVDEKEPEAPCWVVNGNNDPMITYGIVTKNYDVQKPMYFDDTWFSEMCKIFNGEMPDFSKANAITHWMPLPKRPQKTN